MIDDVILGIFCGISSWYKCVKAVILQVLNFGAYAH